MDRTSRNPSSASIDLSIPCVSQSDSRSLNHPTPSRQTSGPKQTYGASRRVELGGTAERNLCVLNATLAATGRSQPRQTPHIHHHHDLSPCLNRRPSSLLVHHQRQGSTISRPLALAHHCPSSTKSTRTPTISPESPGFDLTSLSPSSSPSPTIPSRDTHTLFAPKLVGSVPPQLSSTARYRTISSSPHVTPRHLHPRSRSP